MKPAREPVMKTGSRCRLSAKPRAGAERAGRCFATAPRTS